MSVEEFRQSIILYREMIEEGHDPLDLLNTVDSRLADISNHIAVCHRVLAEQRCLLNLSIFPAARRKHSSKIDSAGAALDQVIAFQDELFHLRLKVLRLVADRFGYQSGRSPMSG